MLQMSKEIDCNLGIFFLLLHKLFYRSHDMIFEMFEIENFINKILMKNISKFSKKLGEVWFLAIFEVYLPLDHP